MNRAQFAIIGCVVFALLLVPKPIFAADSLESRFALVLPSEQEELWRTVGWHTNLMKAREVAQQEGRPIFYWIMVGNPHGCT